VVFGGKPIAKGNEVLPYFPIEDHVDAYGRSKSVAEQLVLKSNGRPANYPSPLLGSSTLKNMANMLKFFLWTTFYAVIQKDS